MPQIASGISKNHQKFRIIPLLYAFSFKFQQKWLAQKKLLTIFAASFKDRPVTTPHDQVI